MKIRKLMSIVAAAFFISSPSIAQTSEQYQACINSCYQFYLAGMNACRWASNPTICNYANEQAYFECRLNCTG